MPLRNRVDPFGAIFSSTCRGTMMGNRGLLHNDRREIVRPFKERRWIACLLEFKGIRRAVMTPGRYTELFFLDEATALAAGHRPCAECRRERFNAFKRAWCGTERLLLAPEIDAELHRHRIDSGGRKVTYDAPLDSLPNGCFVQVDGAAFLVWDKALHLWSPTGYTSASRRPAGSTVTILTPRPIVDCLLNGYVPETSLR